MTLGYCPTRTILERVEVQSCLAPGTLTGQSQAIKQAVASGDMKPLQTILRAACPDGMWAWPGYTAWADHIGEKPTRIRMITALADLIYRSHMWRDREIQLAQNREQRPFWQLRPAGDRRDWPECAAHAGRIERADSPWWQQHAPWQCSKVGCRCSVRAYRADELTSDHQAPG